MTSDSPPSDRPLRIGISCFPTFGGSGIIATEIGETLARQGHRVHFIAADVPQRLDRLVENVFFHEVEAVDYPLFQQGQGAFPLALASKMVEVSVREALDVLHVHYALPHATSAVLARQVLVAEGRARPPKIITTLHGTDITLVGSDPSFLPITRFSILGSDAVTVPSEWLRRGTIERISLPPATEIEVIPNFVDTDRFRPAPRDPAALSHLFDGETAREMSSQRVSVLVHNSNFRPLKRTFDVIRAFAAVRSRRPAVLILVGDGPDRSRAEDLARELGVARAVRFLGKQLNFLPVLQGADAFLLPSETESFGLAALEAMSCGVPVVASRVGGVPEVVGDTGVLHDVGDVAAITESVLSLLSNEELRAGRGAAARARTLERFQRAPMVARYEALYRRVLAR